MKKLLKKLARMIAPVEANEIAALAVAEAERLKLFIGPGYSVDVSVRGKASWETPNVPGHVYEAEAVFTVFACAITLGSAEFVCKSGEGITLADAVANLEEELRRR